MRNGSRFWSKLASVLPSGRWASVSRRWTRRCWRPAASCSNSCSRKVSSGQDSRSAKAMVSAKTSPMVGKRKALQCRRMVSLCDIAGLLACLVTGQQTIVLRQ